MSLASSPSGPLLNRFPCEPAPTPLVPIRLAQGDATVWAKLEFLNPSGSTKDRIAAYILDRALASGAAREGGLVIEASSGSTSIALALACAQRGLRFIAVMPEGVSSERAYMIRAFGGEVRFSPRESGVAGAISETQRLAGESGAFLPRQFSNPDNAAAHELATAREIAAQIPGGAGKVDMVVSGVGTGGTLVGLYRGLRKTNPSLQGVVARPVEIVDTPDHECCSFGSQIPGVVDCVSDIYRPELYPEMLTVEVPQERAIDATRRLIRAGFPVGASSGLNYVAAQMAAQRVVGGGDSVIVTVLPDRMERYFSTSLFAPYRS